MFAQRVQRELVLEIFFTFSVRVMLNDVFDTYNTNSSLLRRIGLFYNAIPYQYWKDQVEEWARKTYPDLWEHLAGMERTEHEEGQKFDAISNEVWV